MRFAIFLMVSFLICACTKNTAKSDPLEQDPVNISGKNIHNLTPTCTAAKSETLRQEISCRAALKLPSGEVVLNHKQADLSIEWQVPLLVSGSPFNVLSQSVLADGLQFDAVIELDQGLGTQVQLGFKGNLASGPSTTTTQTVTVPFSVTTYGFTPQLRDAFVVNSGSVRAVDASTLTKDPKALAKSNQDIPGQFVPQSFPASQSLFNFTPLQSSNLCSIRDKLFFATSESIYVLQNNRVRLFAGNRGAGFLPPKESQFTDPFEVELGRYPGIACKEGLFEADDRVFAVSTTIRTSRKENLTAYPILYAEFRMDGSGVLKKLSQRATGISAVALSPKGELFILDFYADTISLHKISTSGVITSLPLQTPPEIANLAVRTGQGGIAADSDGTVYLAIPESHSIFELRNGASTLTRIAGTGTIRPSATIDYDKPSLEIALNAPQGIAVLSAGTIVFAEKNSNRVFRLDIAQRKLSLFLGEGNSQLPSTFNTEESAYDGEKLRHSIPSPLQLSKTNNNLWITLSAPKVIENADTILRVSLGANNVPEKVSLQSGGRYAHIEDGDDFHAATSLRTLESNEIGTHKKITGVRYLRYHGDDFCILDSAHGRLYCVGKDGRVRTLAGGIRKSRAPSYNFTTPVSAFTWALDRPEAFAFAPDNSIFISLYDRRVILKITPQGAMYTVAGLDNAFESPDAAIFNARPELLIGPTALDVDSGGNVYFIDRINQSGFRGTYIKKLTPQANGTYSVSRIAGAAVNGPISTSPYVKFEEGTGIVNSPFLPLNDLRVGSAGQLFLAVKTASVTGYLNRTPTYSGSIYRLTNGSFSLIAGGPQANSDSRTGDAKAIRLSPAYLDLSPGGVIYASDEDQSVRRISPTSEPGTFVSETLAAKSISNGRCGGGVRKGTGATSESEQLWIATLNTVCIGNPLGLAVKDECTATNGGGDFSMLFAQEFDAGVGNSIVVEARRGCF